MPETELQDNFQKNDVNECAHGFNEIPLTSDYWKTEYDGYGQVVYQQKPNLILIEPKAARAPASTHAGLVLSKFNIESENFDLIVEYKNNFTLRVMKLKPVLINGTPCVYR